MSTPLLANILNQAEALRQVRLHQLGDGRKALERAAGLLRAKRRVIVTGMGASLFAAMPCQYRLAELGIDAAVCESSELLHFKPHLLDGHTTVVLVSRSGESIEVTKLLSRLKARGCAIVGVVNVPRSTLGDAADASIVLDSPADQMVAIQTYVATVAVLRLLCDFACGEANDAFRDLEAVEQIVARWLPECASASEGWRRVLPPEGPLYILGRGPSLGSVHEGVLLMHETAKAPAVGMSVAQFRHGPVEVVDARFRAVLLGTQPATVELEAALFRDINAMGGQAQWIGPAGADLGSGFVPWPSHAPARFSNLLEVMPLQLLAYRWAEWRGVRPGDFRWAPLVTNTEAGFPLPNRPPSAQ